MIRMMSLVSRSADAPPPPRDNTCPRLFAVVERQVDGARLGLQQLPLFLDGLPPPLQHPPLLVPHRLLQLQLRSLTFPSFPG